MKSFTKYCPSAYAIAFNSKLVLFFLFFSSSILGEQINVDTTGSDTSGDGSLTSPFKTIQYAINHTNTNNGDVILVGPGVYVENINFRGKNIIVGSHILTTGDKNYILETIIDGGSPSNSDSSSVVVFVNNESRSAQLIGFTIQNGSGTKVGKETRGGGIFTYRSSPSLRHLFIANNTNTITKGGGIFFGNGSDAYLDSTTIYNNAVITQGGGIYFDNSTNVIVDSVIISNNKAKNGGGIFLPNRIKKSKVNLTNVKILANEAVDGGGIHSGGTESGVLSVLNGIISNNIGTNRGGGVFFQRATNIAELFDVKISFNKASNKGGGIFNSAAKPIINRAIINGNSSKTGGAVYAEKTNTELNLINVIIHSNRAAEIGGAIYGNSDSNIKLFHSTISGNSDPIKGAVYPDNGAKLYFYNSILWDNNYPQNIIFGGNGSSASRFEARNSIVQGLSAIQASSNNDVVDFNSTSFETDPLFENPMYNNYDLRNNSPAIGFGSKESSISPNSTPVSIDINNNIRPSSNNPDMGANENELNSPSNSPPTINIVSDIEIEGDSDTKIIDLYGISDGDYHYDQSIQLNASSSDTTIIPNPIIYYTSPENNGAISIKPDSGKYGIVNISIKVTDNGGTDYTGIDTSLISFKVRVKATLPKSFEHVVTNYGGAIQGIPRLNNIVASEEDWIAAFDSSKVTVGSTVLTKFENDIRFGVGSSNFILHGDDPLTNDIDEGMNEGEYFTLELWDASRNAILIQIDSSGNKIKHNGWSNTNFIPIAGFNDPSKIFNFYYNVDPIIEECLVTKLSEDTTYQFGIKDLKFSDNDDILDEKLQLIISPGDNYTVNGTILQPEKNYNGQIKVPFKINDGISESAEFIAQIEIEPVDDSPEVKTPISDFNILEDSPSTLIDISKTFTDVDSEDSNISIKVVEISPEGKITSDISTDTLTLDYLKDQNGDVTITLEGTSNGLKAKTSFTTAIYSVNDPPTILNQDSSITVNEDSFLVVRSDYFSITDVDNTGPFSIIIQPGENYTFASDTLFPNYNYVGELNVNIKPDDRSKSKSLGSTFSAKITVLDTNDPPELSQVAINPSIADENDTLKLSYAISDPEGSVDTTVTISWYKNKTLVPTLSDLRKVNPDRLFCDDSWYATIIASDGELSTDPVFSNSVTICKENTPPVWNDDPPISLIITEDSDSTLFDMTNFISDEEQALSQIILKSDSIDTKGYISASFVNGNYLKLSTLKENYFTPNDSIILISMWADDGYEGVDSTSLNITITALNDAPIITEIPEPSIGKDSIYVFVIDSVDYYDPENDSCSLIIDQGNYFSIYGDTIQPSSDFSGTLNIPFSINDGKLSTEDTLFINVLTMSIKPQIKDINLLLPEKFVLYHNYPNPFNPSTKIAFDIPENTQVKLIVWDIVGKRIRTLVNESVSPGNHEVVWDGKNDYGVKVSGGVYLYSIETRAFRKTRKMLLLK